MGNTTYYPILKKAAEEAIRKIESGNYPERQQRQGRSKSKAPCPDCGTDMSFIEEYRRWYCDECEDYAPEGYRPRKSRPRPRSCPDCGGQLSFVEEYKRWYCYDCEDYAPEN